MPSQIPSVNVGWGNMSVVDAERRLLAAALADRGNERFVLLSESCIPIRNLTYTHYYLFANNTKSYLDSFLDVQNRYNARMAPTVTPEGWRKGSQWFALTRYVFSPPLLLLVLWLDPCAVADMFL